VRDRRRYERAESRRFTQRTRRRRMAWLISGASVAALVVVVLLAAYSPLLAVRTVAVEGVSRLDPATVTTALDDQLGRPLALVDYGAIERDLAQFPYIESYSVEARPPDTLAVRIVERRPVAQLQTDAGFDLIDAAGVTVQESPERIAGFPVLDLTGTEIGSPGFRAAAAVLMSLPDALIAQVDRISGTTPDSVTMVFTGAGQRVVWGDADDSELKARILERLIATQDPSLPVEYDVSSPQSPVIR
jgi:cell division protein FtsQ